MPFIVGFTLFQCVAGHNEQTASPGKQTVYKGFCVLMEIAKVAVVPQGTTISGMVGKQLSLRSQLERNL